VNGQEKNQGRLDKDKTMRHDITSSKHDAVRLDAIQHACRYGRVIGRGHAADEAENAQVQARDIEHAIRSATRAVVQGSKVRLEGGTDLDGDELVVVVCEIQCGLKVITVW
jgi:hypothetical protein